MHLTLFRAYRPHSTNLFVARSAFSKAKAVLEDPLKH